MFIDRFENILQFSDKGNERIVKYPMNAINDMIIVGDQFDNPLGIFIDENHNRNLLMLVISIIIEFNEKIYQILEKNIQTLLDDSFFHII